MGVETVVGLSATNQEGPTLVAPSSFDRVCFVPLFACPVADGALCFHPLTDCRLGQEDIISLSSRED